MPHGSPMRLFPDWVCEILSTNKRNDLVRKKRVYHRHELPHYWILDPLEQTFGGARRERVQRGDVQPGVGLA